MPGFRMARHGGGIGGDHFPDEEVVAVDQAVVVQAAREPGMAFADRRRRTCSAGSGVMPKASNLSSSLPVVEPSCSTCSLSAVVGSLITAHALRESGRAVGKIVLYVGTP